MAQKAKKKQTSIRIHTRKIDREVARRNLRKMGYTKPSRWLRDNWKTFGREVE